MEKISASKVFIEITTGGNGGRESAEPRASSRIGVPLLGF